MTQCTSTAVDVHFVARQVQLFHRRHGNDRKSFVDFVKVHICRFPTGLLQQVSHCGNRRCGEPLRLVCELALPFQHRQNPYATGLGFTFTHQHQRGRTIGNRAGISGGNGAVLAKRRAQLGNFVRTRIAGALIHRDFHIAFARADGHWRNFPLKRIGFDCGVGARQGFQRKCVLLFPGEGVFICGALSKVTHQLAVVGIFQAVGKHMVEHFTVTEAHTRAGFGQQVGRIAHAFHPASNYDLGITGQQRVTGHHHGLHAGATHLVDGGGRRTFGDTGTQGCLTRRCLTQPGRQYTPHQNFVHVACGNTGVRECAANCHRTQFRGTQARQRALHCSHGSAGNTNNDHRVCNLLTHSVLTPDLTATATKR